MRVDRIFVKLEKEQITLIERNHFEIRLCGAIRYESWELDAYDKS